MRRAEIVAAGVISLVFIVLDGCQGASNKTASTEQAKPVAAQTHKEPLLYTGKQALGAMHGFALRWAPDALPIRLESAANSESNGQDGKATVWQGMFASASRGTFRTYTWSGSRLPASPAYGVTSSMETSYRADVEGVMFQPVSVLTDSDAAFATAQSHGGANLTKKDPKQPVVYSLVLSPQQKQLLWYVVYGSSRDDSKGMGIISASTGAFLRAAK